MAEQYNKWERFYNKLNLWFNGVVAASLIPFALIFLDTQSEFPSPPLVGSQVSLIIQVVVSLLAGGLIWLGIRNSKLGLVAVSQYSEIAERLQFYLHVKIKSFIIVELAAILACVAFYVTKAQVFSGVYLVVLFTFSLTRPTFDKVSRDIQVPEKELESWGKENK